MFEPKDGLGERAGRWLTPSASCSCARNSPGRRCSFGPLWLLWHRLWLALAALARRASSRSASQWLSLRLGDSMMSAAYRRALADRRFRGRRRCAGWTLLRARLRDARRGHRRRISRRRAALLRRLGRSARCNRSRADAAGCHRRAPCCRSLPPAPVHRPVPAAGSEPMTVAIIDYGSGNLHSAAKAFERAARESGARRADRGDARSRSTCAAPIASCCPASAPSPTAARPRRACPAWSRRMTEAVRANGRPFLGICVGMQLMAERGREHGVTDGPRLDRGRGRSRSRRAIPRSRSRTWAGTR